MQTAINVKQLSKSYGNKLAVDNISLSVKCGTVFGLLGANGAGKSTTIECILGTKTADSGTVTILGHDPKKDRRNLFQNVGVQFQECDYQPEIKVSELCEETACLYKNPSDWKKLCVQFGIESKINNAVKNLSGGERQRLFIVLALIPNPRLIKWSVSNIMRAIKNATYTGTKCYNKSRSNNFLEQKRINNLDMSTYEYVEGDFPAIISQEIWDKAQAIRESRMKPALVSAKKTRTASVTPEIYG